ncbi:UDP-N-acetylmuramoyl-L-alanyl-D-glutamate--2,6-diaminopimelate ligase [Celerinatantimonas yamalensis]|uniref:UDP-N-acetylmuramoyl-L-alanyl-D-glutamate--2,6-diaminopimelate ligase n=1 Tax=Celerinatantimonas yamalensis TaxID=559956 RepID=A0ABW9G6Z4_9GAMM
MKVKLAQLIAGWLHQPLPETFNVDISDLFIDSRAVIPNSVFIAIVGATSDGRDYIQKALCQGAAVVLSQVDDKAQHGQIERRDGAVIIHFYGLKEALATLAQRCYRQLPRHIIGVTGTNGKSTVTHLLASLAELNHIPAAVMGTLGQGRPGELHGALNTTADIFSVYRILNQFALSGIELVAMEVSSHGLVQGRVAGVPFTGAVFTNLTRDHLDYHHTMQAYGEAKAQLMAMTTRGVQIINADDAFGQQLLERYPNAKSYALECQADWQASVIAMTESGCQIRVHHHDQQWPIEVPLLGQFNVSNLLAAIACLDELGLVSDASLGDCLALKAVPGRMELFCGRTQVVVDYAHTPDALAKALQGVRSHCSGKLICIFGCGGDRDRGKRPLMAQAAENYADQVIVTNDNPRSEDPSLIADDICQGFEHRQSVSIILDRRSAIQAALAQAQKQDMILVAGKGHEDYQIIGQQRLAYDERAVVAQLLAEASC